MNGEFRVFEDLETLSRSAARVVVESARRSMAARERFNWVLSGGHTPKRMYALLAGGHAGEMPWEATHVFWGDERCVPPDSEDSNFRMAREALLDAVPIPESNIHRIPAEMEPSGKAAEAYEARLAEHFRATAREGRPPAFDLLMLGMGGEGHTASLFPGSPALEETRRWVVSITAPEGIVPAKRVTLTLPVINAARRVFFLAAGRAKRGVIRDIRNDPGRAARLYPAARVSPRDPVLWFVDREAAG